MASSLISFDVGIKNLAYCVFELSGNTISIIDWSLANLTEDNNGSPKSQNECTCNHMLKSKQMKMCEKKAKYRKGDVFACEKHAKSSTNYMIPQREFSFTFLKKLKIEQLKEKGKEHMYFYNETKKMNKADFVQGLFDHLQKQCWTKIEEKKIVSASKMDLISIGRQMHIHFSQKPFLENMTYAIIENQISPIANRMKTIQGMITQEFIMRNCPKIEYISSSNKLNHFLSKSQTKEKMYNYKAHKKDSINICRNIIESQYPKWLHVFDNAGTKKDDLADSFLQGLWYIQTKINV